MNSLFLLLIAIVAIRINWANCESSSSFPGEVDFVHSVPNVSLPLGQNYSTIGHYSGFLRTSLQGIDKPIHYWFFKSQADNWQIEPLILWHGGYVSAINAALTGISPIRMNRDGTLRLNEHAWNKRANLLFVESFPVVGFVCEKQNVLRNDTSAIQLGLDTLEKFYVKFPQLAQNELYIAGQGYVSFHIVDLAKKLLEMKSPPNLKGVLIGNGVFNISDAMNSHFKFVYQMKRDFYEPTFWTNLIDSCCPRKDCSSKANECTFRECQTVTYKELERHSKWSSKSRSECNLFYYKFVDKLIDNFTKDKKQFDIHNIKEKCVPEPDSNCTRYMVTKKIFNWFNVGSTVAVREALNIVENGTWRPGHYSYQCYLERQYPTLHGHLMFLLRSNIRILLYTGDEDGVASKFNTQWLLDDLSLNPMHQETFLFDGKLVGFRTHFCEGLTHYRITDAGHTVAEDQAGATLEMVSEFLFGEHQHHPANALSHCPQTVANCTKYCTTEPSPAKEDGFCIYWMESLYRYYKDYRLFWFEIDPNTGEYIMLED